MTPDATRRDINTPCGLWQGAVFFPGRSLLLLAVKSKAIVPFAGQDDLSTPSLLPPLFELFSDTPSVEGQRQLGDSNPFPIQVRFELSAQEEEPIGCMRMMPSLLRTKQQRQGQGHLIHGAHHTEEVLPSNDFMMAPTQPVRGPAYELSTAIHHTVINRYSSPGSGAC